MGLLRTMGWTAGAAGCAALALLAVPAAAAPQAAAPLQPCRVEGMPTELQCGVLRRALDPAQPDGVQIDVHYLVVPAMARNKQLDPVLMLAGGPGQSAIAIAPAVLPRLSRLNNRRDLVFIDQRGTGKSAPLQCPEDNRMPLAKALDPQMQLQRIRDCRAQLGKLPHGDMRFYTTTIAMQDFDAVREALGAPQWNLVGGSYGTRAALEYLRQFPTKVRRTVLDGVAPPDMVLPLSMSADNQGALDAVFAACDAEPQCKRVYPTLRADWAAVFQGLPRQAVVLHPVTGLPEQVTLTRESLLRAVRGPLYQSISASALPPAIHAAAQGRYESLLGLGGAQGSSKASRLAMGMHFSVVCAEDLPRYASTTEKTGRDFGSVDGNFYSQICADWPRGTVPAEFYTVKAVTSPVLVLSGGIDPVTPPRHAERVAAQLGSQVQHIVVPQAGHGIMGVGCMRDIIFKFIDAKEDAQALPQDAACAIRIPRAGVFVPTQFAPADDKGQP